MRVIRILPALSRGISRDWRLRCVFILPGSLAGQFNVKCTTWISDSIEHRGRRAELVVTWLGTHSEPANLAAIRRGHRHPQTWCCTRPHIRPRPMLVRQERSSQRRLQSKQSASSVQLLVVLRVQIGAANIVPSLDPSCRLLASPPPHIQRHAFGIVFRRRRPHGARQAAKGHGRAHKRGPR